jgi:glycosyltransferase involved in cell wall biosynthesis
LLHERARQLAGTRLRDRIRGRFQVWVIRRLYRAAEKVIFTVPLQNVPWLEQNHAKALYIPIGANIPERIANRNTGKLEKRASKIVAVFCLSLSSQRLIEIVDLVRAAERVRGSIGDVRFVILGKGSEEARPEIEAALSGKGVEFSILGRLPADEVADTLAAADALLYLCGHVTQTRGSALASVACGLPIVGYASGTREPIHDAGVELVPYRDREALAAALVRVLTDAPLLIELRRKSSVAQQREFSWDSIAHRYMKALGLENTLAKAWQDEAARAG